MYRIVIVLILSNTFTPVFSQISKAKKLLFNVVSISSGSEDGFGFISGIKGKELYLITADHVITEAKEKKELVNIRFYKNFRTFKGEVIFSDPVMDIAMIVVEYPESLLWENNCLGNLKDNARVVFIGKEKDWYIPSESRIGNINGIKGNKINADLSFVPPGSSGAPLVSEEGIVGMILESNGGGSVSGISITEIKKALPDYDSIFTIERARVTLDTGKRENTNSVPNEGMIIDLEGNNYRTKLMQDGNRWMTTNLNLEVENSWCYRNKISSCEEYGRLYTLEAARAGCKRLGSNWRLPSDLEWTEMIKKYGGEDIVTINGGISAYFALMIEGKSGFNARLSGWRDSEGKSWALGLSGIYWSDSYTGINQAWHYEFRDNNNTLYRYYSDNKNAYSVRCIQEN